MFIKAPAALTKPPIVHAAHALHNHVERAEGACHWCYVAMVAIGSANYYLAAGAMIVTALLAVLMKWIITSTVALS